MLAVLYVMSTATYPYRHVGLACQLPFLTDDPGVYPSESDTCFWGRMGEIKRTTTKKKKDTKTTEKVHVCFSDELY